MEDKNIEVAINKKPSFVETWYEGSVMYNKEEHKFWLVDPKSEDPSGDMYECEVKWFFKNVPREVRASYNSIIEMYKSIHYNDAPAQPNDPSVRN